MARSVKSGAGSFFFEATLFNLFFKYFLRISLLSKVQEHVKSTKTPSPLEFTDPAGLSHL